MIRVVGAEDTREYSAAVALRKRLVDAWPAVAAAPEHDIRIVAGAKCHGQKVRDIDLLLLASFGPGAAYRPFLAHTSRSGQATLPETVQIHSVCVAIEVKDHDPEGVRFVGPAVRVRYGGRWHDASEQNHEQVYSVKGYLEQHGIEPPYITGLIWLRNVPQTALPARPHNIVGAELTWEMLINVVGQLSRPRRSDDGWVLDAAGRGSRSLPQAADLFTKVVVPTRLDRLRMERVTQRTTDLAPLRAVVGRKLLLLRGRGGTGKTMHLLQLAHHLAEAEGARILILTYNKALVADIRRLLTVIGVSPGDTEQTIQIETVHGFLHGALQGLGFVVGGDEDFLESYDRLKDEALEFLRGGAVSPADLEDLPASGAESFRWDYVFVDEGQDWPRNERDLLLGFYSPSSVVVADGIDQMVRSQHPVDWRGDLGRSRVEVVSLRTCLRMKSGLARFVTAVSQHLGLLRHEWEANEEAPGGRVVVVDGPYFGDRALHDRLLAANAEDGNHPVDALFCVPPQLVTHASDGGARRSVAAAVFERWGFPTWDGASRNVRESYPTDLDQLRIVQYESCRGLEGWLVVNLALDRFYDHKLVLAAEDGSVAELDSARHNAARWLTIPLSRAMDTLVIQLDLGHSPLRGALEAARAECADYVEWIKTG